jgi:hypothetical protein
MTTRRETGLREALGLNADATPFPWQEVLLGELLAGAVPRRAQPDRDPVGHVAVGLHRAPRPRTRSRPSACP